MRLSLAKRQSLNVVVIIVFVVVVVLATTAAVSGYHLLKSTLRHGTV